MFVPLMAYARHQIPVCVILDTTMLPVILTPVLVFQVWTQSMFVMDMVIVLLQMYAIVNLGTMDQIVK